MSATNKVNWLRQLFSAPTGNISSKRVMGVLCILCLCACLFVSTFSQYQPSTAIVESLTIISIGCLGLTSIDIASYTRKNKTNNNNDNDNLDNENAN